MPILVKLAGALEDFTKKHPELARHVPVLTGMYMAKPGEKLESTLKGVGALATGQVLGSIVSRLLGKRFGVPQSMTKKIVMGLPGGVLGDMVTYYSAKKLQAPHETIVH